MSLAERSRSLSKLFGESVDQLSELFQVEIQLAQAELSEKVANAGRGATYLIAAAVFAIPVVTLLLVALALGIRDWSGTSLALAFLHRSSCRASFWPGLWFRGTELSEGQKTSGQISRSNKSDATSQLQRTLQDEFGRISR